jgi:hypothetical protein
MSVLSLESIAAAMADRQARIDQYAKYVAIAPIDHGGVRAYNTGDRVPIDNVELHGYLGDDLVAELDSPEGRKALGIPEPVKKPAKSASLPDWQKYAGEKGLTPEEIEPLTRDELAARFEKES